MSNQAQETFHLFWKRPELSQWGIFDINIPHCSHIFNCAEQAMMYAKAMLHVQFDFRNAKIAQRILNTDYPAEHKRLGRIVSCYNDKLWNDLNMQIVYTINWYKFQNQQCRDYLLSIKEDTLVEASPFDPVWGIELSADDPRAQRRETWQGQNRLGQVLTMVRNDIINDSPNQLWLEQGLAVLQMDVTSILDDY